MTPNRVVERDGIGGLTQITRAAALVGVPSVMAMGFGWFLIARLDARTETINQTVSQLQTQLVLHDQAQIVFTSKALLYLQKICINTAKTDQQRDACTNQ